MQPKLDLRIDRKTVQEGVVEKLREAILAGLFLPGDRLVEADLCASLGVSRPSVREALRNLQAERLIEIIPNRGPQIPILSWRDAEEIYGVRSILEGEAAALCAATISDENLAELGEALSAVRLAVKNGDPAKRVQASALFYGVMLRSCGNRIIEQLLETLLARVNFLRSRSMSLPGRAEKSFGEVNAIFLAIKRRDPQAARKAATQHVMKARQAAQKAFSDEAPSLPRGR